MSVDLSGTRDGIPERFVPGEMRGHLIEAEHLARYRWAGMLISGGRVLDAGCGLAYGTSMLARSGASEVIGVDSAVPVLDAVRADMPDNVTLEAGDIRDLPHDDGSFDAVVCFEVLEHLDDPGAALDELARVLAPQGLLVASSPNRNVYPPTNPHHHHEFLPQELAEEVGSRFSNVRLVRQHDYISSAILTDEAFTASGEMPLGELRVYKSMEGSVDREAFTLALASDGPLPDPPMVQIVTDTVELNEVFHLYREQEELLQRQLQYIHELEERLRDERDIQSRLIEAEQNATGTAQLEEARMEIAHLTARLEGTKRLLDEVLASPSWRLTAPLRALKRRFEDATSGASGPHA